MREASTPFSCTRYTFSFHARSEAALHAALSAAAWAALPLAVFAAELPTMTSLAPGSRCAFRVMSSRQALASLSTRVGRFGSLLKAIEQRLFAIGLVCIGFIGGGGGAWTITVVLPLAD